MESRRSYPGVAFRRRILTPAPVFSLLLFSALVRGQEWSELFPSGNAPSPPRYSSGVGYDEANDRLILFSGEDDSGVHPHAADIWVLSNATAGTPSWTQLSPPPGPVGRIATATYDPVNNRLLIHGGAIGHSTPVGSDTWALTHANSLGGTPAWIMLANGPQNRWGHVMAHDADNNRTVVFGGNNGFSAHTDVAVLDHGTGMWTTLVTLGTPPPARVIATGDYDPNTNRLILFGGDQGGGVVLNDVWVLEHANGLGGTPTWTSLAPLGAPPAPRAFATVLYDTTSNRLIVFGGNGVGVFYDDVWILTNANGTGGTPEWLELVPSGVSSPVGRTRHAAGYNSASNRMVIAFGRNDAFTPPNNILTDVWMLSNANGTKESALFVLIDEDTIDNGINCSNVDLVPVNEGGTCSSVEECAFFSCPGSASSPIDNDPSFLVNDDEASIPGDGGNCPNVLRINTIGPPSVPLWLPTGEVGDEGLYSVATSAFADIPGGLPGYIGCSPDQDENFLDGIAGAPLTAEQILALGPDEDEEEGRTVCAVVHDSDVSDLGGGLLSAKGARNGRTAFKIISVVAHPEGDKFLPTMQVDFLDSQDAVDSACACENLETIDGDDLDCTVPEQ